MLRNLINRAFSSSSSSIQKPISKLPGQNAAKGDRVVVLGSGWGGFQLALNMAKDIPLTVISPLNHFVFTPLLPSAAVGTLECRCIQEPIRRILGPHGSYLQAKARRIDLAKKQIICDSIHHDTFAVDYDKLVIAVGVKTNTFGIDAIKVAQEQGDDIFFLKQLAHARAIRMHLVDSFEKAALPTVGEAERKRLLSFLVVGGGPTSCEFTAELHDFCKHDVKRLYPELLKDVKISLVEAGPALLGPFDKALQAYALRLFRHRDIDIRLGTAVTGFEEYKDDGFRFPAKRAQLSDGSLLPFGTMVWSAGLAPRYFTQGLDDIIERHPRTKRILVDEYLRIKGHEGSIWAIGDAAINETGPPLPQVAQVARQQGIYLGKILSGKQGEVEKPFRFYSLGSMANMGEHKGIYDGSSVGPLRNQDEEEHHHPPAVTGFLAFFLWRFAYWGRQTSIANKILIPMYWTKTYVFGRDISRY